MLDAKQQAERVNKLVAEGMDMTEAIEKVLRENMPVTGENRLEYIKGLDNLELLEKFKKRAHARKSKMKNNAAAVIRYQAEIDAAAARMEHIRAKISESPSTLQELIKMGAKRSTVIQTWLSNKEKELEPKLKVFKESKKLTNKELKVLQHKQAKELPAVYKKELEDLGQAYLEEVVDRLGRGDQRVIALIQKRNIIG